MNGLEIRNNAGKYLLSSELSHYSYLGRASLQPMQASPAYKALNNSSLIESHLWTHRTIWYCDIVAVRRPVCAIDLPQRTTGLNFSSPAMGIHGLRQISSGVWRLFVLATAGWVPPQGCVYIFVHTSDAGPYEEGYGLRLFGNDGSVNFDSSKKLLVGAPGTMIHNLYMPPAHIPAGAYDSVSHWWWGFDTTDYPIQPRCGTFITGNAGVIANEHSLGSMGAAILYPLFSYYNNNVRTVWTPVFLYRPWNTYQTFHTDGTWWYTLYGGSQGGIYTQKVILIDPALYA